MLKVGVWLNEEYSPQEGGGFAYYDKLIKAIDEYKFPEGIEIVFVSTANPQGFKKKLVSLGKINWLTGNIARSVKRFPYSSVKYKMLYSGFREKYKVLQENGIHLLYYPVQAKQFIPDFPFISTNWDLGHITTYPFPEMVQKGEFEEREFWYKQVLPQALAVFAESQSGKEELIRFLNLPASKIEVVPLFAGEFKKVPESEQEKYLQAWKLKRGEYFFYPAQFWAHKNHYNLLLAFSKLREKHREVKLVFTGADKGNLGYIQRLVKELGLQERVVFAGFVSSEMLYTFYTNAIALIMPSFLGPTNMPLLEARELHCAVACSDFAGHREMLGDGALYFQPEKKEQIAAAMEKLLEKDFRIELIQTASASADESIFKIETALERIAFFLVKLKPIRKTWD